MTSEVLLHSNLAGSLLKTETHRAFQSKVKHLKLPSPKVCPVIMMNQLFVLILAASSVGPPIESALPDAKSLQLVRQLGHKSFAVREAAARDIIEAGGSAVPALMIGTKNADAEVAERCQKLIPLATAVQRNKLLTEFLKEPLGPAPKSLAGAERFLKITGDSKQTRQLYAKMLITHHQIIETMEVDPQRGSQLMSAYVIETYQQWRSRQITEGKRIIEDPKDFSTPALLMFVRANPKYIDNDQLTLRVNRLSESWRLPEVLVGVNEIPGMRKLFLNWLAAERQYIVLLRLFQIAEKAKLKEAVPTLLKITTNTNYILESRLDALIYVGRVGDKDQLPTIASMLDDTNEAGTFNLGEDGPMLTVQVRDVALIVSVFLAGEKPEEYGYDSTRFGAGPPIAFQACGFPDAAARDQAHARWKERIKKTGYSIKK